MAATKFLEKEDHGRDEAFQALLHGSSSNAPPGILSMRNKDGNARDETMAVYNNYFHRKDERLQDEVDRQDRRNHYAMLTKYYYDLSTDLYEYGWSSSFHFCRFGFNEPFAQAIARHEHYLASKLGLSDQMTVLDVGCGVGGPAKEMGLFSGANIIGLNNNDYQIHRARRYVESAGLSHKISFFKGDFMQIPFPDNSFDAVYAIEATVHAPSLEAIYKEIFRVLKPGGQFGVYEWLMTDKYDNSDEDHRKIRFDIEQGNGISNMVTVFEALAAIDAAGFKLKLHEDLAQRQDTKPWYYPLAGDWRYVSSMYDILTCFRLTWLGLMLFHGMFTLLELLKLLPKGTRQTADMLASGGAGCVKGGQQNLFTPMYLMIAQKPEAAGA